MSGTLIVAILGLLSGGAGTLLGVLNLRRSQWGSRLVHTDQVRETLREMQRAIARLEHDRDASPRTVNSVALQTRREELLDLEPRLSDRRLRKLIHRAESSFGKAVSYDTMDDVRRSAVLSTAKTAVDEALARVDLIDRKS